MSTDLPPASISGQQGWEWNQLRAQQEPRESAASSANRSGERSLSGRRRGHRASTGPRRASADTGHEPAGAGHASTDPPQRELAAELERKERRVQHVIDHYERKLAKKNRELAKQSETASSERLPPLLSSFIEYLRPR